MLRNSLVILVCLAAAISVSAQKPDDVLATVGSRSIKLSDLGAEIQQAIASLPTRTFATRTAVLDQMVSQRLLAAEAKATGSSPGRLIAAEKAKVPAPTEAQIKEVYDANRQVLGDQTLDQARKQIVAYLKREPEQKALSTLLARLKTKYLYSAGKPVNGPDLAPADVVATVNGKAITAKEYNESADLAVHELKASIAEVVIEQLSLTIFDAMIAEEAAATKVDAGTIIANEVTNKLKEYTNEERAGLEMALAKKLSDKFKPVVLYKAPEPIVQKISVDDDPSTGPADAPVTIVMFSDFQCPACAAAHPVLKSVIAEFPGKVRFVVRDFPLESIHENAFDAARAAAAAHAQGKYFEYIDILYKKQDAQDKASLLKYAADLGLNAKQFELDFNAEKTADEVRKDQADGDAYIVNSTPTIFVNGIRVRELSAQSFRDAIGRALSGK